MHLPPSQKWSERKKAFLEEANSLQLNAISENKLHRGRRLGAGTFSVVSEAYLESDRSKKPRVVALKELRSDRYDFERLRRQLLAEAAVLARLKHNYILQYIGCGLSLNSSTSGLFMVQEFVPGGSLHEFISRLRRRRTTYDARYSYSLATALRWAMQVSCAVEYLHSPEIGIIHRDIKLANLLLTQRQIEKADVKLADFGLSVDTRDIKPVDKTTADVAPWKLQALSHQSLKNLGPNLVPTSSCRSFVPQLNQCTPWLNKQKKSTEPTLYSESKELYYDLTEETGSYMYMSPEVWLGLPYNDKADIYSLGVLIAELLTGKPFSCCLLPEKSYEEAKVFSFCVANGLRLKCPKHFPKPLASILESCWEPDPTMRPTADEVYEALKSYEATVTNAHKLPLFHPMCLTSMQKLKLGVARMKYLHSQ